MSLWYYVDAQQQRQGPMEAEQLATAFQQARLGPDSLVWREGLPQWTALTGLSAEPELQAIFSVGTPAAETAFVSTPGFAQAGNQHVQPAHVREDHAREARPPEEPASPYASPVSLSVASLQVMGNGDDIVLAGFWKRYAAMTIDSIVMMAAVIILIIVGVLLIGGASAFNPQALASDIAKGTLGITLILAIYILPLFLQAAYFSWMHASGSQATLGKMAVGIKVTRTDGNPLGLGRSFGRWAAYFFLNLFSCGVVSLVSAFTAGLSARKQGVHDMVVDTLVVDRWAFTSHPERQRRELGGVTISMIILSVLLFVGYFALVIFAAALAPRS